MAFDFSAIQRTFFTSNEVLKALDKKTRSALSKFGAFVRTRARSSIRKRKKASEPGSPPSSHVGTLKKLLFFGYDAQSKSVVVGPVPFRGPAVAPALLEYGGQAIQQQKGKPSRRLFYRPRPFMQPALKAELPKFAGLFKG